MGHKQTKKINTVTSEVSEDRIISGILSQLKGKDLKANFERLRPAFEGSDHVLRIEILNGALSYFLEKATEYFDNEEKANMEKNQQNPVEKETTDEGVIEE